MKFRRPNRFLSATLAATGFALSLSASFALTATKEATGDDLTQAASWTGGSGPGFPTSADIATWTSTSLGAGLTLGAPSSWGGISASGALSDIDITGAGTLTVGSSGINMSASTVNLSLANPVTLGGANTWTVNASKTLTLSGNVAGGQNLTIAGGGTSTLSGSGANSFGTLAVGTTASSATTSVLNLTSGATTFSGRPCIGSAAAARGVVKVSGTATLTFTGDNLMFAGAGATNLRATGVLKQSGGTVNNNVTASTLMPWAGTSGVAYGAYLLSGGTLNVAKEFRVNNQGSDLGFFSQSGGDSTFTTGLVLNNNGACNFPAIADISGGTLTHPSTGNLMAPVANLGVLTVRGTGYLTDKSTNFSVASNGTGILNLLTGGTIEANQIKKVGGTATMNCDGGTLKAYTTNAGVNFLTGLNNMFLYSGGLALDTAGQSVTIGQSLVAPAGYGVGTSLGTIAVTSGGTGYIAPPVVTFAAPVSGVAATGVAEIDANGTVTQIRITSPGSGYTNGQSVAVTFNGGDNTANEAATVATPPSVTASTLNASGGLTKSGTGTLTLNNTETYTGATTVNVGTLALGVSGALNSASNVSLAAGATLDVSALGASATYTLGSSATLLASGTGTTVGTNAATITGGVTGTVSLGSRPVTLTWGGSASGTDSTHPALTVSQGTLSLNSNQFTVVSGTPLNAGIYTLATAPAITGTVNPTPLFTGGSGIAGGNVGVVSISGNSVILTVSALSATINVTGTLSAVTTTYGTASAPATVAVSGSGLSADITAIAPAGLEISSDGSTYGSSTTFTQSGGSAGGTLYVRIKNNSPVSGTFDAQNITLSSPGAVITNVTTAATGNSVSAKALTIVSAVGNNKMYDGTTAATVTGTLDSAEAFGTGTPADGKPYTGDAVTAGGPGTFASPAVGNGIAVTVGSSFTLGGASAGNYTVTQPVGLLTTANIITTAVWTQAAGGSWPTTGNWQQSIIGNGTGNTADFSTLSLTANATVTLDGARTIGNLVFDDLNATKHSWTVNPNIAGALTLAVDTGAPGITNNVAVTLGTVLAGTQGLAKSGTGTLTLSGANTLTGGVTIIGGTLSLGNAGALNSATPNTVALNANNATLKAVNDQSNIGAITVASGVTGATLSADTTSATVQTGLLINGITLNAPLTVNYARVNGQHCNTKNNGKITGTGVPAGGDALIFTQSGSSGNPYYEFDAAADNDFTGNVHVKSGSWAIQAFGSFVPGTNKVFPAGSMLILDSGTTWSWNNASAAFVQTVDGLAGGGTMNKSLPNYTLTIDSVNGSNEGNRNFSGNLSSMTGTLTKTGAGTQKFSGTAIAYTNATTINNGTLELSGTTAFASSAVTVNGGKLLVNNTTGTGTGTTATITVKSGATLAGAGSIGGAATIEAGGIVTPGNAGIGTLAANNVTFSGICQIEVGATTSDLVAVAGTLTTSGSPTIAISTVGTPTAVSYTIATYGTLIGSQPTVTGVPAGYAVDTSTAGQIKLVKSGYSSWAASWPGLTDTTPGGDPDHDGVTNLMEYVVGGDPRISSTQFLPTQMIVGPNLVISYKRSDESKTDTTQTGQWSTNLATWTNIAPVMVNDNGSSPDDMTVTIPVTNAADGKLFGRINVTQP